MGDRSIDDEDFDYGGQIDDDYDDDGEYGNTQTQPVANQPHDEEIALSDTDSFGGGEGDQDRSTAQQGYGNNMDASLIDSGDDFPGPSPAGQDGGSPQGYTQQQYETRQENSYEQCNQAPPAHLGSLGDDNNDDDEDGDNDDRGDDGGGGGAVRGYNAMEFHHLNVSDEIRELFKYVERYNPHTIDLDTQLKPFVPDYIPSVGGIDEFIKVPRPDGKPDYLGLKVLDEAAAKQSDATVLTLQLRQLSKEAGGGNNDDMVGRIEHKEGNKEAKIQQWVNSVSDIHKSKPAATVSYTRQMPDIDALMQEWPPEMEAFIRNMKMPSGELDLDLATFSKMVCGILDIPVFDSTIESLHVLFTLYLEFKNNPIFAGQQDLGMGMGMGGDGLGEEMGMGSMGEGMSMTNPGGADVFTL